MQQATQSELFAQLEEQLSKKGCFLVVGDQSSPNFMTIGWDFDKAEELGVSYLPAEKVRVPLLDRCAAAYECRVIYETEMHEAHLDPEIVRRCYREGDYHTLYFGEILACHTF